MKKWLKITLVTLASLIVGLWLYTGSLKVALLSLVVVPVIWISYGVLLILPQPSPDPHLYQQLEQLSWEICRDINKHSVEFCEEEIKQMRKKIGVR